MKAKIYYFSGTGNSMRAAEKIAKALGDSEIISMRCNPKDVPATDAERIGFVFPVYHWIVPEVVQRFIKELEMDKDAYVFAISTPSFVNGKCFELLDSILREKGTRLYYAKPVYSVANYVMMYPPMPNPEKRVPKTERKLEVIAEEIREKKVGPYPVAGRMVRMTFDKIMPKYIANIAGNDKYFFVDQDCISCGLCTRVCPCHNIELKDGKPVFKHQCTQCMSCIVFCPKGAINAPDIHPVTKKRMKYHNPYIDVKDILKEKVHYDKAEKE